MLDRPKDYAYLYLGIRMSLSWGKIRRVLWQILTLPFYILFCHIFMLGVDRFLNLHPRVDSALLFFFIAVFIPGSLIYIGWHFRKFGMAFIEGMREAQAEKNS